MLAIIRSFIVSKFAHFKTPKFAKFFILANLYNLSLSIFISDNGGNDV